MSAEVERRTLYLATTPDSTFATLHTPLSSPRSEIAVVMCPPFGWADMCTYRTRRVWADAFAASGHPTLRLDLPGTGDSGGTPYGPDRLGAWSAAISDAARWLKSSTGAQRVVAHGISLGGMLAWMATANGAPIDDLILWAVPTRGTRLLREMWAAAVLDVDTRIEWDESNPAPPEPDQPGGASDEGFIDVAGRLLTHATMEALGRLDLEALPLPPHPGRRMLVFRRDQVAADGAIPELLAASGVQLTEADGDGYVPMMQYPRYSIIPLDAIDESVKWLERDVAAAPVHASQEVGEAVVGESPQLELLQDGALIRETPLDVAFDDKTLRLVLAEPVERPVGDVCGILLNNGSDRRVGPNRMWVDMARSWAARGIPTVRVDQYGVGDADGPEDYYTELGAHFDDLAINSTIAVMDDLASRGLPNDFVLAGFCSGAFTSFHTALRDERVKAVLAVSPGTLFWNRWNRYVLHSWAIRRKLRTDDSAAKKAVLLSLRAGRRALIATRASLVRSPLGVGRSLDRALKRLEGQGTQVLLLFNRGDTLYQQYANDGSVDRAARMDNVRVAMLPGWDANFRPLPLQRFVRENLDRALDELLAAGVADTTVEAPSLDAQGSLDVPVAAGPQAIPPGS